MQAIRTIANTDDTIDIRDVIARVEELRETRDALHAEFENEPLNAGVDFDNWVRHQTGFSTEEADELTSLEALLTECEGNGGDEQWEGNWYPVTLIHELHFVDAMRELCDDIGDFPNGVPSYYVIDWEATAENLRADYTSVEFDGVTYWVR